MDKVLQTIGSQCLLIIFMCKKRKDCDIQIIKSDNKHLRCSANVSFAPEARRK
jgi:hypothetical protein